MSGSIVTPRFLFGRGVFEKLGGICGEFGRKAGVFLSGSSLKNGLGERALALLEDAGVSAACHQVPSGEPTPQVMREAAAFLRRIGADMAVAIGGGSVLDTGKLAAALAANEGDVLDYIEGVGSRKLARRPLPFVAAPTTAGTGSEMSKNSVVIEPGRFKNSVRDDRMLARVAVVDPLLTLSVPRDVTASSGADAVCQLIEAYTTKTPNSFTDALALQYMGPAVAALEAATADGGNVEARETMALSASASGICLANSGLGMAHGISAALGTVAGVPHGIGCGILMPVVAEANAEEGVARYQDVAERLGLGRLEPQAAGRAVARRLREMNEKIGLPADLRQFGIAPEQLERIASLAAASSSGRKNPVAMGKDQVAALLRPLI